MAVGARLCGGLGALGLSAAVGTGLRPSHLCQASPGLRVPQQPGAAGQAGPSARPIGAVDAEVGRSAVGGGRPAAAPARRRDPAGGTLSVDVCHSCAPRGLSQHGAHRPVFACRPDMRQHMQQLQQHCLELWTRRLLTLGAGRKDYFLAGYLPRRPGGGAPARPYEIVRTQRPRKVWPGRARHRRRTSGRRRAACALSTCSRSASSAGRCGGEWRTVARGGTRATQRQWRGQQHPRGSCRRGWCLWSHHLSHPPSAPAWRRYRR